MDRPRRSALLLRFRPLQQTRWSGQRRRPVWRPGRDLPRAGRRWRSSQL